MMDRRTALARLVALTGGMVVGAEFFLAGCRRPDKHRTTVFTPQDVALMDEIGETIIPTTDTPGAKAAGIGAFMAMMVNDCYDDATHAIFTDGLGAVDAASRSRYGKPFVQATASERTALLGAINQEARDHAPEKRGAPPHYFKLMRDLTLLGYFSSPIGCTQALRYVEVPGSYDGNVSYRKGDRAFYTPMRRVG